MHTYRLYASMDLPYALSQAGLNACFQAPAKNDSARSAMYGTGQSAGEDSASPSRGQSVLYFRAIRTLEGQLSVVLRHIKRHLAGLLPAEFVTAECDGKVDSKVALDHCSTYESSAAGSPLRLLSRCRCDLPPSGKTSPQAVRQWSSQAARQWSAGAGRNSPAWHPVRPPRANTARPARSEPSLNRRVFLHENSRRKLQYGSARSCHLRQRGHSRRCKPAGIWREQAGPPY